MKLAVSNLAWDAPEQDAILEHFTGLGVSGIEIAPTKVWPDWSGATMGQAAAIRRSFAAQGFEIPALQSVLFGHAGLQLFAADSAPLIEHLTRVAGLAGAMGARAIVFGSPRNRDRGEMTHSQAMDRAVPLLRQIGDAYAAAGSCFCLEPNPAYYNCNFLTHWQEVAELVTRVGHPGVGVHLDIACIHLAGDDPVEAVTECAPTMRHFHISEPELGDFAQPKIDHAPVGAALRASAYSGYCSIEMRRQADPLTSVLGAIAHAKAHYG